MTDGSLSVVQTVVRELNKGNTLKNEMLVPLVRLGEYNNSQ